MKSPRTIACVYGYLVAALFLFLNVHAHAQLNANTYLHQRKDSLRIIRNETESAVYVFSDERKNSAGDIVRLVIRNNHRYQLKLEKTERYGKVFQLRDSTNTIIGTILLKEHYNIIFPDGKKLTWYDRDSRGEWGFQQNMHFVIRGQKNNGAYSTRFVLDDIDSPIPTRRQSKSFLCIAPCGKSIQETTKPSAQSEWLQGF